MIYTLQCIKLIPAVVIFTLPPLNPYWDTNAWHLYIYFACLFVSNERQYDWTDLAHILYGTSYDHREGLWMIKIKKISLQQNLVSIKY